MIVAVCLSFVCNSMGKITHVDGCRPNMVVTGKDDPLELIKFWCLSRSECGSRISFFSLSLTSDGHFIRYIVIHQTATL